MDIVLYFVISTFAVFIIYFIGPFIHKWFNNYDPKEYEFVDRELPEKKKRYKPKKGVIYE